MDVPFAKLLSLNMHNHQYNGHHQQGGSQHLCHKPKDKWFGVLATKFTSGPTTAFTIRLARSAPSYPSGSIRKKQFFCHVSCYDRAQNDSRVNVGHVYPTKHATDAYCNPYKGDGANQQRAERAFHPFSRQQPNLIGFLFFKYCNYSANRITF